MEDFQKPENAAALQKTLSSCNLVMANDARAAVCTAARQAKFALDTKEIGRIRREQIAKRNGQPPASEEGLTVVEKSLPDTAARQARDVPVGPGEAYRAELEPGR